MKPRRLGRHLFWVLFSQPRVRGDSPTATESGWQAVGRGDSLLDQSCHVAVTQEVVFRMVYMGPFLILRL